MSRKAWFAAIAALLLASASAATVLAEEPASSPQLTGTQLASALLPPSFFGSGNLVTGDSAFSTGSRLELGPAKYNLATSSCHDLYFQYVGWGETATAGITVGNKTVWYSQAIYQFASPAAADVFFATAYRAYHRCASVVIGSFDVTTQSLTTGHVNGLKSFTDDQSFAYTGPGTSYHNYFDIQCVLDGADVYEVIPSRYTGPSPASAAVRALEALMTRVRAL
jgi:hypothetical protein